MLKYTLEVACSYPSWHLIGSSHGQCVQIGCDVQKRLLGNHRSFGSSGSCQGSSTAAPNQREKLSFSAAVWLRAATDTFSDAHSSWWPDVQLRSDLSASRGTGCHSEGQVSALWATCLKSTSADVLLPGYSS